MLRLWTTWKSTLQLGRMGFDRRANKYIDETAPWILAKDEAKADRLKTVMYNLAETLRIVAILISPYIPTTSPKIYTQPWTGCA